MTKSRKQELLEKADEERRKCRDWLLKFMRGKQPKFLTKAELCEAAMRELKVSKNSFNFAWISAIEKTRRYDWHASFPNQKLMAAIDSWCRDRLRTPPSTSSGGRQTGRFSCVTLFRAPEPIRLSTHSFKAATTGFGSALHNAGLSSTAAIEKRLAASRLRKFQFHTFATIWLALYLG
jgi:hypothetical protein